GAPAEFLPRLRGRGTAQRWRGRPRQRTPGAVSPNSLPPYRKRPALRPPPPPCFAWSPEDHVARKFVRIASNPSTACTKNRVNLRPFIPAASTSHRVGLFRSHGGRGQSVAAIGIAWRVRRR